MGESSKVGISASKVVALIGTLILIRDSISYFYTTDVLAIIFGVVGLIIAFVIFDSLEIIDLKKLKIPYIWWVLLIIGLLLILFEYLMDSSYLAGILVIIAAIIEILSQKKEYAASKIVTLIGACYVIYESIMFILGDSIASIALAIVGIIFGIILLLTLFDKVDIKVPYTWWVVLIIGFVIFTWVSQVSGTIIMVGFILILMAF